MAKMKKVRLNILMMLLVASNIFATSVNGRFVVIKSDSTQLSLLLQINTNTGTDDMGGATIVVSFDKNILDFSSNPTVDKDFKFFNFSGGNYNEATITKPLSDKLWINIDLPVENNNKGTIVSGLSGWTDVVMMNFDIRTKDTVNVKYLPNNIFWQIYDGDNKTNWSTGSFINLVSEPANVKLLSFKAELLDNSNISFDWSTITYAAINGYDIERSTSIDISTSSSSTINWEKIGFVNSQNNLNTPEYYRFIDNSVQISHDVKYRILSINNDETRSIIEEYDSKSAAASNENKITNLSFDLEQNYPNPFNPSTKIRYTIPTSPLNPSPSQGDGQGERFVTLKVFDILGNEVATLVNEQQSTGQHEVIFDATGLASGVYIYKIDTGSFISTKKMILLR